jgi:hypothetical protein
MNGRSGPTGKTAAVDAAAYPPDCLIRVNPYPIRFRRYPVLNPDTGVVEVREYCLDDDVEEKAFMAASAQTQLSMKECPGYVSREVFKGEEGYLDVVHWERLQDADEAVTFENEDTAARTLFDLLDEESLSRRRFIPVG